jgi:hypothetical protein
VWPICSNRLIPAALIVCRAFQSQIIKVQTGFSPQSLLADDTGDAVKLQLRHRCSPSPFVSCIATDSHGIVAGASDGSLLRVSWSGTASEPFALADAPSQPLHRPPPPAATPGPAMPGPARPSGSPRGGPCEETSDAQSGGGAVQQFSMEEVERSQAPPPPLVIRWHAASLTPY